MRTERFHCSRCKRTFGHRLRSIYCSFCIDELERDLLGEPVPTDGCFNPERSERYWIESLP